MPGKEQRKALWASKCDGLAFVPARKSQFPPFAEATGGGVTPASCAQFCFPEGVHLRSHSSEPTFFANVLTDSSGARSFVCVLIFWERVDTHLLVKGMEMAGVESRPMWAAEEDGGDIFSPTALCIVSRYPFLEASRLFLKQVYRLSLSVLPVPLERYISNYCSEVPAPPAGRIRVNVAVGDAVVQLSLPGPNRLPHCDTLCYLTLFSRLSARNIVLAWSLLLQEARVCFFSGSLAALAPSQLALISLLFPFDWAGVFVPCLPNGLLSILSAPMPFCVGIMAKDFEALQASRHGLPEGVVFIDLDGDRVLMDSSSSIPALPEKASGKLLKKLHEIDANSSARMSSVGNSDAAFIGAETVQPVTDFALEKGSVQLDQGVANDASGDGGFRAQAVREAFLRFFTTCFQHHEAFILLPDKTQEGRASLADSYFDEEGFLKKILAAESGAAASTFFHNFLRTQMWTCFVQERTSSEEGADELPEVQFFRDAISAKINRLNYLKRARTTRRTDFIDDKSFDITETFSAPLPLSTGTAAGGYVYDSFPTLSVENYGHIRRPRQLSQTFFQQRARRHLDVYHGLMNHAAGFLDESEELHSDRVAGLDARRRAATAAGTVAEMESSLDHVSPLLLAPGDATVAHTIKLQSLFRGHRLRRKLNAATVMQAVVRRMIARNGAHMRRTRIILLQSLARARKQRGLFYRMHRGTVRLQAVCKASAVRRRHASMLRIQLADLREDVLRRWRNHDLPFFYRREFCEKYFHARDDISLHLQLSLLRREANATVARYEAEEWSRLRKIEGDAIYSFLKANADAQGLYLRFGVDQRAKLKKKRAFPAKLFSSIALVDASCDVLRQVLSSRFIGVDHIDACKRAVDMATSGAIRLAVTAVARAALQALEKHVDAARSR
eukprot:g1552.t1